ncbi:hypothetical protein [Staphylococcus epidermidis]|uniref:hypothetical protein n=1 Tax=Staphylococcus epidermidis TaxID=1282 RepID=UPI0016435577|nr:hypothetical protein [Staphylococcus epidermidis]
MGGILDGDDVDVGVDVDVIDHVGEVVGGDVDVVGVLINVYFYVKWIVVIVFYVYDL